MPILLGLLLVVSLSVNAQVLEPQHRTQNWFSAWAAFGSSVKAVLPLYLLSNPSHRHPGLEPGSRIPHQVRNDKSRHCERSEAIQKSWMATSPSAPRHDDLVGYARNLLNRLKRIQELLVHIAESTSSVSQQQKKEELRTQLSLLEYRPDLEEEEKETVEIIVGPVPVVLLPPMHQLPSSTGAAPEGGNPGDPNPAAPALGAAQQLPAFNATQATEWTLAQLNCKLKAIKNARPPNCGQVILSGIQGYGPQIGYALLATIISKFIPPTTKTIPGLESVNAIFKTHTEWPVIAYELEYSPAVLNKTPWNRPLALGVWVTRVGNDFLVGITAIRGPLDLSFLTQVGNDFLYGVIIRGPLDLSLLTQVGDCFLFGAEIQGKSRLPALSRAGDAFLAHASISGNLDLPALSRVGDGLLSNAYVSGNLRLPALIRVDRGFLFNATISGNLDLPSLTQASFHSLNRAKISGNLNLPLLTKMGSDFLEHAQITGNLYLSSLTREDIDFGKAASYHTLYTIKTSPSQGPDQDDSRRKQRSYCCCF